MRIRDLHVGDCLTVGELQEYLSHFKSDSIVITKFGNKNFLLTGLDELQNTPILYVSRK